MIERVTCKRPTMRRLFALALAGLLLGTSVAAWGQDRGGGRPPAPPPSSGNTPTKGSGGAERSEEVDEGGGSKVKVMRFSGFDISGRLKSPQLLYFLNRLRAEFDRPRLPHRSFMPELQRSTKGRAF